MNLVSPLNSTLAFPATKKEYSFTPLTLLIVSTSSSVKTTPPTLPGGPKNPVLGWMKILSVPRVLNCSSTAPCKPKEILTNIKIVAIEIIIPNIVNQLLSFLFLRFLVAKTK